MKNSFAKLSQTAELAAFLFIVPVGAQVLVGVVAELFEFHKGRKDQTLSLHAFCPPYRLPEFTDKLSVEEQLFSAQRRVGLHFDFFR